MLIVYRWCWFFVTRPWCIVGLAGLTFGIYGAIETNLAAKSAAVPEPVKVADLEAGKLPAQPYVDLDRHAVLYPLATWREKDGRVQKVVVPIVPPEHPVVAALQAASPARSGAQVDLAGVAPLVFVQRRGSGGAQDVPKRVAVGDRAVGMLFRYDELADDEQRLVAQHAPRGRLDRVVVIELDRHPKPLAVCVGLLLAGMGASFLAVRLFFRPRAGANG